MKGTVKAVQPFGFHYEIEILVEKVPFKALITKQALFDLQLHEGSETVVSFKATAVHQLPGAPGGFFGHPAGAVDRQDLV